MIRRCLCGCGQFFQDDEGAYSLMRLMAFLAFVAVLGVWVWGNLAAGHYVPLGYSEAGIISAAIAGKAVQARIEYGGQSFHGSGNHGGSAGAVGGRVEPGDSGPSPENLTPSPRALGGA